MSNSLEVIQDPIDSIQKKYEMLSNIQLNIIERFMVVNHIITTSNIISLIMYFEVLESKIEEVKQRFNNLILSTKA